MTVFFAECLYCGHGSHTATEAEHHVCEPNALAERFDALCAEVESWKNKYDLAMVCYKDEESTHTATLARLVAIQDQNAENGRRGIASAGGYQNNQKTEAVHAENCANARLIAAAPDLLAALKIALPYVESFDGDNADRQTKANAATVRAAIARATGSEVTNG